MKTEKPFSCSPDTKLGAGVAETQRKGILLFILFILLIPVPFAFSQTTRLTPDPGERQLEQFKFKDDQERRDREAERLRQEEEIKKTEEPVAASPEAEPSFYIEKIEVLGNSSLSNKQIEEIIHPYSASEITPSKINELMKKLTEAYLNAGFVASRVYLPKQNLTSKILELRVIEGKVSEITINDGRWPDRWKISGAVPAELGDILQMRSIEQGLDQMNRVPSGRATVKMAPGEKEGETKLIFENKPVGEYRVTAGLDNFGNASTGRLRKNGTIGLDNVLNLNENVNAFYTGTENSNAFSTSGSVPFEWWTLSSSASYSEYLIGLAPGTELFGTTWSGSSQLSQTVYRDGRHKLELGIGGEMKNSGRIINDTVLTPQRLTVFKAFATHSYRLDDAQLVFDLSYHRGVPYFGADEDLPNTLRQNPHREFNKFEGGFQYTQALTSWLQYRLVIQGQYALEGLFGTEQIFAGDNFSVRGYRESIALGDDGLLGRNEFVFGVPGFMKNKPCDWFITKFQPFLFTDAAYLSLKSQRNGTQLWGAGAGMRWNWDYLSAEATWGKAISDTRGIDGRDNEFYLSFTAKIF